MEGEQSTDTGKETTAIPVTPTAPAPEPAKLVEQGALATPAPAKEERTYTKAEFSKMQSTRDKQLAELEKTVGKLNDELRQSQEERRLFEEAMLDMNSNADEDLLGEKKPNLKMAEYQKKVAANNQQRQGNETETRYREWADGKVNEAKQMLVEAGLDPLAPDIAKEMAPLVLGRQFDQLLAKARTLAFGKLKGTLVDREALRKEIEREVLKKHGLDQQDLGTGGGPSGDLSKLTSREKIELGLEEWKKKSSGGKT